MAQEQNLSQRLKELEQKSDGGTEFSNVATALASIFGKQKKQRPDEVIHAESTSAFELGNSDFLDWEKTLGSQDKKLIKELPAMRMHRYQIFERMAMDPIIFAALKLHANTALAYNEDKGEIVSLKFVGEEKDKESQAIVDDLRQLLQRLEITDRIFSWGLDTLKYGMWPVRIWGDRGAGVTNVTSNIMTHPSSIKMYERNGRLAGYTSRYQHASGQDYELMPPWSFVIFRMQGYTDDTSGVPVEDYQNRYNIGDLKPPEHLVESWNYGRSILEGSFLPWVDLQESVIALNMSRRLKSKRDRMIGYPIGGMAPARAAALTQAIATRLKQRKQLDEEKRIAGGYVPSQDDFLLPYDINGNGKIEFSTIDPNPDISQIEDVMFHVKRICGALGLDPSLIGFGDMLAGGLGEGGWFRSSILAAATGEQLRRAIASGLNRIFEIHLAYKYKVVFPAEDRPWKLEFHAASSAKEIENNQSKLMKMDLIDRLNQSVMAFKESGVGINSETYAKYAIHQMLGIDEDDFESIWDKKAKPAPEGTADDFKTEGGADDE